MLLNCVNIVHRIIQIIGLRGYRHYRPVTTRKSTVTNPTISFNINWATSLDTFSNSKNFCWCVFSFNLTKHILFHEPVFIWLYCAYFFCIVHINISGGRWQNRKNPRMILPPMRIELTTPGLQDQCSAAELWTLWISGRTSISKETRNTSKITCEA